MTFVTFSSKPPWEKKAAFKVWNSIALFIYLSFFLFFCLEELYDEVSALLNETYQKLIAPPEEAPSVS